MDTTHGQRAFPDTRWTLIQALDASPEKRRRALEMLCEIYHRPLVRLAELELGCDRDTAMDVVQAFVMEKVLQRDLFSGIERRAAMRLRSYLKTAMRNFCRDHARRVNAQKRGGGKVEPLGDHDPAQDLERVFDREWARAFLDRAHTLMEQGFLLEGSSELRAVYLGRIYNPHLGDGREVSVAELAEQLAISPGDVRNRTVTVKRRFEAALLDAAMEIAGSASAAREELAELHARFSAGGAARGAE